MATDEAAAAADASAEHTDVIVVGSGFGGSVAACRLAEAGLDVVVLERGRAHPPGSFPRTPAQAARAFWAPASGRHGLFDVRGFRHFDSVVASGLGGGSLIYANVLLRKDEHWFVDRQPLPDGSHESWPVTRADLDPHYDAVERVLTPVPYPLDVPGHDDVPKAHAMRQAAERLGLDHSLPPLAVSFAPEPGAEPAIGLPLVEQSHTNLHGVARRTCRLCGECNIGCNEGAKNSLDLTYLSRAQRHGADLRTGHEVRAIRPAARGGYEVDHVRHEEPRPRVRTLTCTRLVLAAGTYGTTHLLLANRKNLPGLGPALGTRFSANGDLLSFAVRAQDTGDPRSGSVDPARGPVITSTIRLPDTVDGPRGGGPLPPGRGGYLQDGGYPAFVGWLVEAAGLPQAPSRARRFLLQQLRSHTLGTRGSELGAAVAEFLADGALSDTSLPLLGMGRDIPDGVLRLRGGSLDAEWSTAGSTAYYERVRTAMRAVSEALGGRYADSPHWLLKRIITVHPCGGAPMGRTPAAGVCDAYGEVQGHPGLYVMDAAALPGPVGTNPALTVAALADRACTALLENRRPTSPAPRTAAPRALSTYIPHSSVQFTETMKGIWTPGISDPRTVESTSDKEPVTVRLTVTVDDIDSFLDDPRHTARVDGWIEARGLGGRRPVTDGEVHICAAGPAPGHRELRYRLPFTDCHGRPRTLTGAKDLAPAPPTRLWPATTTLPYVVLDRVAPDEPDDEDAVVVAAGTLRISPTAFLRQLTTFRTTGPHGATALARFHLFFLNELRRIYG